LFAFALVFCEVRAELAAKKIETNQNIMCLTENKAKYLTTASDSCRLMSSDRWLSYRWNLQGVIC